MSGPASVTKHDFREAIKFWPFPPQNDLKWRASQFFLQQVKLLLCQNVAFLAFIPSARGEIKRVDCIMHLSKVMRAGLLCVNKTQLNARQEEEKHWEWWGNTSSLNRRWPSSLPDVANNLKKRLNPAFYWNIFCRYLWLNKGLSYIIWRQNRG